VLAYDPATVQLLLFGGSNGTNDTWKWTGTSWTQLSPATSPKARVDASMAYDPATRRLVLFGGHGFKEQNGNGILDDTWNWIGTTWAPLSPATSPPSAYFASMADDPASGQLILAGGLGALGDLDDTWTWRGLAAPAFTSPASASRPSGTAFTVKVMATGTPIPTIVLPQGSVLPTGLSLTNTHNGDGTGTLAGTASVAPGSYVFTLQAINGLNPSATQTFTLNISTS
jgi:hypothetical protein